MLIRFWGVRGSVPTPLRPDQVQAKIAAAVSRITSKDVESEESKMRFLSRLPSWIYGTSGGNTPCVEVRSKNGDLILIDCGTGLRSFAQSGELAKDNRYSILLSHFHWDHIQGIPFFSPLYNPETNIDIYTGLDGLENVLASQNSVPCFPENASWDKFKNRVNVHKVHDGEPFELFGMKITCHRMNHPGYSYAFSIEEDGKKFIYATDAELHSRDFIRDLPENSFFKNADMIVLDSQYTDFEAEKKVNWGHSSFGKAMDFAGLWNIKKLFFFHFEPGYDDKKLDSILSAGVNYKIYKDCRDVELYLALEGQEVEL